MGEGVGAGRLDGPVGVGLAEVEPEVAADTLEHAGLAEPARADGPVRPLQHVQAHALDGRPRHLGVGPDGVGVGRAGRRVHQPGGAQEPQGAGLNERRHLARADLLDRVVRPPQLAEVVGHRLGQRVGGAQLDGGEPDAPARERRLAQVVARRPQQHVGGELGAGEVDAAAQRRAHPLGPPGLGLVDGLERVGRQDGHLPAVA